MKNMNTDTGNNENLIGAGLAELRAEYEKLKKDSSPSGDIIASEESIAFCVRTYFDEHDNDFENFGQKNVDDIRAHIEAKHQNHKKTDARFLEPEISDESREICAKILVK